jgi:hypothetical protein
MRLSSFIAVAAATPLLIAAAQPIRLQPSSPWDVDYAPDSCRLIRTFGEGKTKTKLVFESTSPSEMDMLVVGKPLETRYERVSASFLPVGGKPFDGTAARSVPNGDPAILWSSFPMLPLLALAKLEEKEADRKRNPGLRPPPVTLAEQAFYRQQGQQFATAATGLEIVGRKDRPVILETGSLGAPIAALDTCSRDSLKDWGVDPDMEDKIVRPVWAINPTRWLFESDYPHDMIMLGKESEVAVRLLIDASGKVTTCTSLSHFHEEDFNRISCEKITERARFEPAELADGTKVPSYYTRRVIFRLAH